MLLLHIAILALVQGITEFLPISSSGHLVLVHRFFGQNYTQDDLLIDIAVHIGTLISVLIYFRADVAKLFKGGLDIISGRASSTSAKLGYYIVISSIPVIIVGFLINHLEFLWMRSIEVVAWMILIFGIVLWWADTKKPNVNTIEDMNWKHAVLIGLAQVIALIPGVSRSGITMTAGRFLGFTRTEAARYSMLLAMVAISGAGFLGGMDFIEQYNAAMAKNILIAAFLSFISSWVVLVLMMKWLSRFSFTPFVIYRVIMGVVLLTLIYTGSLPAIVD